MTRVPIGYLVLGLVLGAAALPNSQQLTALRQHVLLDGAGHPDTLAGTVVRGDVLYGNSTPKWARLAKPTTRQILVNNGTDVLWGMPSTGEASLTTTGNIDDLDFSNASLVRMNNATDATLRGLVAGTAGQVVSIQSVGAGNVFLAHQNAGSTAANRLINFATSANTPLAAGVGVAVYQYDGTTARWRLITHDQGVGITPTFAAGDYTASGSMTWTLQSGDVLAEHYYLRGRKLTVAIALSSTTVGGSVSTGLRRLLFGFTAKDFQRTAVVITDNGVRSTGYIEVTAAITYAEFHRSDNANWTLATNNTTATAVVDFEVQ